MYGEIVSLSILCVCFSFLFHFEGGVWNLIVLIPDRCLSIYFQYFQSAIVPLIRKNHPMSLP